MQTLQSEGSEEIKNEMPVWTLSCLHPAERRGGGPELGKRGRRWTGGWAVSARMHV